MVNIFEFSSYRSYLSAWIEQKGDRAYGLKGKIASALNISSSLLSQILKGEKSLTPDQTSDLADFMLLNEIESDYLHLLVELDRAGNRRYKDKLEKKKQALQEKSQKIGTRVPRHKELDDTQKAIYYSSWLYTGLRNLTALNELQDVESLAEYLRCEPKLVSQILRFLIDNGLCKEIDGRVTYGPASLHIDRESPFVNKHHQNWRFQAIQKMENRREEDLFFTSPMSLSVEAAAHVKKAIPHFIQTVMQTTGPSTSETVMCLNIDWFKF